MSSKDYIAPNFIGIGMERAGTSWLFTQIAAHPDIWVPPLKELHFFDVIDPRAKYLTHRYSYHLKSRIKQKAAPFLNTFTRPEFSKNSYLEYLKWDLAYFTGAFDTDWYKRLFHPRFTKGRICGEITPAYSNLTAQTIDKALTLNPNMKFILMVRNPMQRMWSGIVHHFRHIEKRDFQSVSEQEMIDFLTHSAAQNRSDLASILGTWQENVREENLLIQPFEEITSNPKALISGTYKFLGVDHHFLPHESLYKRRINAYTKKDYDMPLRVKEKLIALSEDGIALLKKTHPDIAEKWKSH